MFAQRDGQILILKRAGGAATGGWYLPGGAVDPGETVEEDSARRELFEESGLVASGRLACVAVAHMHVYGHDSLQVLYACDCPDGEVVLSNEHDGARWIDPVDYRDRYLGGDVVARFAGSDERTRTMVEHIRDAVDSYLAWRA